MADAGGDAGSLDTWTDATMCTLPQQACAAGCTNVATDKLNCGRCGHDCAGGDCMGGSCQPVAMTTGTTALTHAPRMTTDGTSVCWTVRSSSGTVNCSGVRDKVSAPVIVAATDRPDGVALQGGKVYFLNGSSGSALWAGMRSSAGSAIVTYAYAAGGLGFDLAADLSSTYLFIGRTGPSPTYDLGIDRYKISDSSRTNLVMGVTGPSSVETRERGFAVGSALVYASWWGAGASSGNVVGLSIAGGPGITFGVTES